MDAAALTGLPTAPGVGRAAASDADFLGRVPHAFPQPASARFEWTRRPGVGPELDVLGELHGRTVVELGCGYGYNLSHLVAVHGARGIGVDLAPGVVMMARAMFGYLGAEFVLADAAAYLHSIEPGSVDVCLSVFGAFSFGEPAALLAAAAVALRPGGRLAMTLRQDDERDRVIVLEREMKGDALWRRLRTS